MLILTFTFNATPNTNQGHQHSDMQNPSACCSKSLASSIYYYYCVLFSLMAFHTCETTQAPLKSSTTLAHDNTWLNVLRHLHCTYKLWFAFSIVVTRRALLGRSFLLIHFIVSSDGRLETMAVALHAVARYSLNSGHSVASENVIRVETRLLTLRVKASSK